MSWLPQNTLKKQRICFWLKYDLSLFSLPLLFQLMSRLFASHTKTVYILALIIYAGNNIIINKL